MSASDLDLESALSDIREHLVEAITDATERRDSYDSEDHAGIGAQLHRMCDQERHALVASLAYFDGRTLGEFDPTQVTS